MSGGQKVLGVIPARYQSKRFPGKVLAVVKGKSLLQWVWENAHGALERIIVATDDERILSAGESMGAVVMKTSEQCRTGSDRVAEVTTRFDSSVVINIQADYPDISPEDIKAVADYLLKYPEIPMATLRQKFNNLEEAESPHHVKVYCDSEDFAADFTRQPPEVGKRDESWEHIGIYGFQREAILKFANWKQSPREREEKLEQLRAMENGMRIKVLTARKRCHGINVPEDVEKFLKNFL